MSWRTVCAAIVLFQLIAVGLIGAVAGFRYPVPLWDYWQAALGVSIVGTGVYCLLALCKIAREGEPQPTKALLAIVARCDLPLVAFLVGTQLAVLGWLKVTMPYTVGFWADPYLAALDALIFGGDPWRLLHALPIGAFIDRVYLTWGPTNLVVIIALSFDPNEGRKGRLIVAYFLTVSSCALGQYFIPSAGPVFYETIGLGNRFSNLPIEPWVRSTADYLWATYQSPGFKVGAGISAFPSLHVAGSCWLALVLRTYLPKLQLIGWSYFGLILVGSVYLGWHYALDGIAGAAITFAAFWLNSERQVHVLKSWASAPFTLASKLRA